ncbi:alpha/beta hydrolase [Olivibacter sp. CPCC 100613]|uniref:alpha/beta hydrolase n=1 Tax=Olivibacter sp. CPCC 100613 TaxID=3079931 RepID=UPI002FF472FD
MRKVKQMASDIQDLVKKQAFDEVRQYLFDYLFYSPKFPTRTTQGDLLASARQIELSVFDLYFDHKELLFNVFSWGYGEEIILLTHGWASKAADFYYLIERLLSNPRYTVIAFDAPGNGSSAGRLTNLLLYVESIHQIVVHFGTPRILIGHSLGAMANIVAYEGLVLKPTMLISLAPLIDLENYFMAQMEMVHVPIDVQAEFFSDFKKAFNIEVNYFNLNKLYDYVCENHWLFYDRHDEISPFDLMRDFLHKHSDIKAKAYDGIGHHQVIRSERSVDDVLALINKGAL